MSLRFFYCLWQVITFQGTCPADAGGKLLGEPDVLSSSGGILDTTITLEYGSINGRYFKIRKTRLLNRQFPGPTVRLEQGDQLRVLFDNQLRAQDGTIKGENKFSKIEYSNLHWHGLHVSGELPSDDVRVSIAPGDSIQYDVTLPADHMPGTHWIHPHSHGSSSLQVLGGAAQALIVNDPDGYLPTQISDATEVVMMIQHIDFETANELILAHGDRRMSAKLDGILDGFFAGFFNPTNVRLINGQYQPRINLAPGEWQRWRIIYGGWDANLLNFRIQSIDQCEMQLLAKDGIYISDFPREVSILPIPAGGRADVMVRCRLEGRYNVLDWDGQTIMKIHVQGNGVASSDMAAWSPTYPTYLTDLTSTSPDTGCSCETRFGDGDGAPPVNGHLFEPDVYLHTVALGSVVERVLKNVDGHPYHQHVYPIQIISYGNMADRDHRRYYKIGDWMDVVQPSSETMTVRYTADDYTGVVMLHCHILPHEDEGTMAQELVIDGGACECDSQSTDFPTAAPTA